MVQFSTNEKLSERYPVLWCVSLRAIPTRRFWFDRPILLLILSPTTLGVWPINLATGRPSPGDRDPQMTG